MNGLTYDTETETVHPVGKPDEFVARACPSVGPLFALAPEMEEAIRVWADGMEWQGRWPSEEIFDTAVAGAGKSIGGLLVIARKLRKLEA